MAAINFKGILRASVKSTVIGVGLVLLVRFMMIVDHLLGSSSEGRIVGLITMALSALMLPAFLSLYLWTGFQAKRILGLRTREAGAAAALAFAVASIFRIVLDALLSILQVDTVLRYQLSPEMLGIPLVFEDLWVVGISLCALGGLALGLVINFVVGMCGAILSENR
ncbi:MAG: hypothetical protein ABIH29_02510 [Candidatus Micrarchaeota archaeon]